MKRPRMIDADGILLCTNDMYAAYRKSYKTIPSNEVEFTEIDAKDVIDFIVNAGFDILIFMAADDEFI